MKNVKTFIAVYLIILATVFVTLGWQGVVGFIVAEAVAVGFVHYVLGVPFRTFPYREYLK